MSLNECLGIEEKKKKPVEEEKKKKKPKKKMDSLIDSLAKVDEDKKLIKKGKVRLHDFEIVPYKFSQSYITGERFEVKNPSMYVHPADQVIDVKLLNGNIYSHKTGSTSFEFHYIIGTAKKLIYGDEDYRKDKQKQYDSFFARTFFGIANRVHFQLNTDFGLVVWSFLRKRKKSRNIKMSKRRARW